MRLSEINEMGRRRRRYEDREVPRIVEDILERIADYLYEDSEGIDTDGVGKVSREIDDLNKDSARYGNRNYDAFNMIPSSNRIGCTDLLITFCSEYDSFEKRILESLDHVSKHCLNTKDVYFITRKWNSSTFNKLLGHIELIRKTQVNIVFIYIGKEGVVLMPE